MKKLPCWIIVCISIPAYIFLLVVESLLLGLYKTLHWITEKIGDISDEAELHIRYGDKI